MRTRLQRIDQMTEPPIVGRYYVVPAIKWKWFTWSDEHPETHPSAMWWPVIGEKHDDVEFFNFPHQHYHTDVRFLDRRRLAYCGGIERALNWPLGHTRLKNGPSAPVFRRMQCARVGVDFDKELFTGIDPRTGVKRVPSDLLTAMRTAYAGVQCKRNEQGWICPHRLAPLGSMVSVDGVVMCSLHGLRIDAATGKCLDENEFPKARAGVTL